MTSPSLAARLVLATTVVFASGAALAKGHGTMQTHHCKMADGTMDMKKTKKECMAAKGTWDKDAAGTMPMAATGAMPMPMSKK